MTGVYETERLLILANTYPNPSRKYRETNCVAAVTDAGEMRRLYPIPFRLLDDENRFTKWEWIHARTIRASADKRPESHRIDTDSIQRGQGQIDTTDGWINRLSWVRPHMVQSLAALEARRLASGETLGVIGPVELLGLEIVAEKEPDWTADELAKLQQDGLFDSDIVRGRVPLRKLPYRFYYNYKVGGEISRSLLTDWEIGSLFWRCWRDYGNAWEAKVREKLESEFAQKDLLFLMGTVHRFPDRWLIVSLIYPPQGAFSQGSLFDLR